jgi:hypothetical protein
MLIHIIEKVNEKWVMAIGSDWWWRLLLDDFYFRPFMFQITALKADSPTT